MTSLAQNLAIGLHDQEPATLLGLHEPTAQTAPPLVTPSVPGSGGPMRARVMSGLGTGWGSLPGLGGAGKGALRPGSLRSHQEEPQPRGSLSAVRNPWKPQATLQGMQAHSPTQTCLLVLRHLPFPGASHRESGVLIGEGGPRVQTGGISGPVLGWQEDMGYWGWVIWKKWGGPVSGEGQAFNPDL